MQTSQIVCTTESVTMEAYTTRRSALINLINVLRSKGASFNLDVPTIVVCGSQSAGKSSVIEAICEAPLPRAHGTCTRCPIEVRLHQGEAPGDWKAEVKLRHEYTEDMQTRSFTRRQQVTEYKMSEVLIKDALEEEVRRAQKAILNPSR